MPCQTIGRWSALFNGRTSFKDEVGSAIEIGAKWNRSARQRDIILDEIPGWLTPLWGSDRQWLYIRRPEGVWKTKIPPNFEADTPILLYQKRSDAAGARSIGCLSIGAK